MSRENYRLLEQFLLLFVFVCRSLGSLFPRPRFLGHRLVLPLLLCLPLPNYVTSSRGRKIVLGCENKWMKGTTIRILILVLVSLSLLLRVAVPAWTSWPNYIVYPIHSLMAREFCCRYDIVAKVVSKDRRRGVVGQLCWNLGIYKKRNTVGPLLCKFTFWVYLLTQKCGIPYDYHGKICNSRKRSKRSTQLWNSVPEGYVKIQSLTSK